MLPTPDLLQPRYSLLQVPGQAFDSTQPYRVAQQPGQLGTMPAAYEVQPEALVQDARL